jgi:hypothetical protein
MLHRFHNGAFGPVFFDTTQAGRLNAPDASYGVLYAAHAADGAFAESFLREPGLTQLDASFIAGKAYATFDVTVPMTFLKLHGKGLAWVGATAEVTHGGTPYDTAQEWSQGLHQHPAGVDGIAYKARHDDDELCYAVFDRAQAKLQLNRQVKDLDADWFYELMNTYNIGLVDPSTVA